VWLVERCLKIGAGVCEGISLLTDEEAEHLHHWRLRHDHHGSVFLLLVQQTCYQTTDLCVYGLTQLERFVHDCALALGEGLLLLSGFLQRVSGDRSSAAHVRSSNLQFMHALDIAPSRCHQHHGAFACCGVPQRPGRPSQVASNKEMTQWESEARPQPIHSPHSGMQGAA
jgi:hypothetical protein